MKTEYSILHLSSAIPSGDKTKNIKTTAPEVHKKTYEAFKEQFVDSGVLDIELLNIYKKMIIRADELLQIFKDEKWKRGHFTYQTISQANKAMHPQFKRPFQQAPVKRFQPKVIPTQAKKPKVKFSLNTNQIIIPLGLNFAKYLS